MLGGSGVLKYLFLKLPTPSSQFSELTPFLVAADLCGWFLEANIQSAVGNWASLFQ
jgi:hypothetical protein